MIKLMFVTAVAAFFGFFHDIAVGASNCGDPPPAQFQSRNDEKLKGDLQGKAQLLAKFAGGAQLGGEITLSRQQVFADYPDANRARTDAYFLYMFCMSLFSPGNKQTPDEKQKAISEFYRQITGLPPPTGSVDFKAARAPHLTVQLHPISRPPSEPPIESVKAVLKNSGGRINNPSLAVLHTLELSVCWTCGNDRVRPHEITQMEFQFSEGGYTINGATENDTVAEIYLGDLYRGATKVRSSLERRLGHSVRAELRTYAALSYDNYFGIPSSRSWRFDFDHNKEIVKDLRQLSEGEYARAQKAHDALPRFWDIDSLVKMFSKSRRESPPRFGEVGAVRVAAI